MNANQDNLKSSPDLDDWIELQLGTKTVVVPQFLFQFAKLELAKAQRKATADVDNANFKSMPDNGACGGHLGITGSVRSPPRPSLSEFEISVIHQEVLAVKERYGISYKDALHRLYLVDLERASVEAQAMSQLEKVHSLVMTIAQSTASQSLTFIGDWDPKKGFFGDDKDDA